MKQLLKNFGANEREAMTFLRLLELGAQPAGVMARQMDMPRSSMYLTLENLEKSGLVEAFERGKIRYFKCLPVEDLEALLKSQERKIKQTKALLDDKLPELLALQNRLGITPSVRHFEGKEAVMKMYERIIQEEDFYAFFNPESVKVAMPEYHDLIPKIIKKHGRDVREIAVNNATGREYQRKYDSTKHQIKLLPKGKIFFSDTILCRTKIYMVAYGEREVSAVEITNPSLAESQRVVFEMLWKELS